MNKEFDDFKRDMENKYEQIWDRLEYLRMGEEVILQKISALNSIEDKIRQVIAEARYILADKKWVDDVVKNTKETYYHYIHKFKDELKKASDRHEDQMKGINKEFISLGKNIEKRMTQLKEMSHGSGQTISRSARKNKD